MGKLLKEENAPLTNYMRAVIELAAGIAASGYLDNTDKSFDEVADMAVKLAKKLFERLPK